ncbi:MAG: hypothetical protein RBU21_07740 [FCB group bacterium]|jgi:hypothetical protein|nr:hypothetical protein [FCB group bacterium]
MRVQTFMGRVSVDSLHQMDHHINEWLSQHQVEPKMVSQCFGHDKSKDGGANEPVVVVSVWY